MRDVFDGQWRLLSFDPVTRIAEWFWFDEDKDEYTIRTVQECEDILASNRSLEAESHGVAFGAGKKVASIPMDIAMKEVMPAFLAKDDDWVKKYLNDPDHKHFRTFRGTL